MEQSKTQEFLQTMENKSEVVEKMIQLERHNEKNSKEYRQLIKEYCYFTNQYQLLLSNLTEEEKRQLSSRFTMIFNELEPMLSFANFFSNGADEAQIRRFLVDIQDYTSNLYSNSLYIVQGDYKNPYNCNDEKINRWIQQLGKEAKIAFQMMNLEFLVGLYNTMNQINKNDDSTLFLLTMKYDLILLFHDLEEIVINHHFANLIKVKNLIKGNLKITYSQLRNFYHIKMIEYFIMEHQSIQLNSDLLVIEVLSRLMDNKKLCKQFQEDYLNYDEKTNYFTKDQKAKIKAIVIQ